MARVYALTDNRPEALKTIDRLKDKSQHEHIAAFWFAIIYVGLGEKDQAFEWLNESFTEHDPALINLKTDARFDGLRSDARFANLLQHMNLPS